jgi:alkaline phosphatase D
MELAVALGATAAWGQPFATRSSVPWHERRDLYPEGVASGDPDSGSVMLWTRRRPKDNGVVDKLHVEVAEEKPSLELSPVQKRLSQKPPTGPVVYWLAD